jgi:hypothetical protein
MYSTTNQQMQHELFVGSDITSDFINKELNKVRSLPSMTKLLHFVGYTGIATSIQLYRFLRRDHTEKQTYELIVYAIEKRYLRPFNLQVKGKKLPLLFYLTNDGYKRVKYISSDLADACCYGPLDQKRMNQVVHDLITTGSILKWREKYEVLWFMSEKQMRQERMRQRWLFWKHNYGGHLPSESIGDYKICLYRLEDGGIEIHECEAAVKYKVEAIASKPDHMRWFTNNEYQQRMIAGIKGVKADIIDPFDMSDEDTLHIDTFISNATKTGNIKIDRIGLTLLDRKILDLFHSTQMLFSANHLLNLLPDKYKAINYSLRKLKSKGLIKSVVTKPLFGTGRGRPENFYYLIENEGLIEEFNAVQRHIILSFVFCNGTSQKGWNFISFDKNIPVLTVEADGSPITFISDHADGETTKVCVRTINDFYRLKRDAPNKVFLVVLDIDRKEQIIKDIPKDNIYDLTTYFVMIKKRSWTNVLDVQ